MFAFQSAKRRCSPFTVSVTHDTLRSNAWPRTHTSLSEGAPVRVPVDLAEHRAGLDAADVGDRVEAALDEHHLDEGLQEHDGDAGDAVGAAAAVIPFPRNAAAPTTTFFNPNTERDVFVELFCSGDGAFEQLKVQVPSLTALRYVRTRVLSSDLRFGKNAAWLIFWLNEIDKIRADVTICRLPL